MTHWYSIGLALVVAAIPSYLVRLSLFGVPTNIFELLVAGVVAAGLLTPTVRQQWREAEHQLPRPIVIFVGLFIVAALISSILSPVPRVSFGIFKSWIIIPVLLGWLVYAESTTALGGRIKSAPGNILNFLFSIQNSLVFSGTIVALLSLTQFKWGVRLAGIYDVPNSLALYLAPLSVLAVSASLNEQLPLLDRRLRQIAAGIMLFVLLLTQSVAGLLSVGAILGAVLLYRRKFAAAVAGIIIAVAAAVYLQNTGRLAYFAAPLLTNTPSSLSVRLQLWDISWTIIKEQPLLGVGLGQFEPAYQKQLHARIKNYESAAALGGRIIDASPPLREFVFRDPHNWALSFWLNTGLLGLLSFFGLHVWLVRWSFKNWPLIGHWSASWRMIIGPLGALAVLLIFGLVDTIYWKNDLAVLHWVLIGLVVAATVKLWDWAE